MATKYCLNIVFKMKTYTQIELNDKYEFSLHNLNFKLSNIENLENTYSLKIKPINDMNHAKNILNYIKIALMLFVLEYNWSAIEIDEDIKTAHMLEKPRYIEEDWLVSGDYNLDETSLFPLVPNIVCTTSANLKMINNLKSERIRTKIEKAFSLDPTKIINDEKLILALEMYSQLSQFSQKRQFLDLITILEILKPSYDVSEKSKETITNIKNHMKNLRKAFETDSEEYKEFERYFTSLHFWQEKSINRSLQLFVNEHQQEFIEYENIDKKIKNAYSIRSKIVHNGIISEDFNEYYDFVKNFVGKLLEIMIHEKTKLD